MLFFFGVFDGDLEKVEKKNLFLHLRPPHPCGSKQDGEATPPSVFTNQLDPP